MKTELFFVFDVESIGLHGEGFAVGGGVYSSNGAALREFRYVFDAQQALGGVEDRKWVSEHVPLLECTHRSAKALRNDFWGVWQYAKAEGAIMAAECGWPVEARFLAACVDDEPETRRWQGPYPLMEIASYMHAAGMDCMAKYKREPSEMPEHDPLADARLSARLLAMALKTLRS